MPLRPRRGAAAVPAALLAVLALTAGLLTPAQAAGTADVADSADTADAAAAPGDVLTLMGTASDAAFYRSTAYPVNVKAYPYETDYVWAGGASGPSEASFLLRTPAGAPRLTTGAYPVANDGRAGAVDLHLSSQTSCQDPAGTFEIIELSRGDDGILTSLAADWTVSCLWADAPTSGSLRWNSDVPYALTSATPFEGPITEPGRTVAGTVRLTNTGTATQTYGASTFRERPGSGVPDQLPVVVTRDGCEGRTLEPGDWCAVDVSIVSDGLHGVHGDLVTPDGTLRGASYAFVSLRTGPQLVTLTAESLRGEVQLTTSAYNPAYVVRRSEVNWLGTVLFEQVVARDVTMPWTDTTAEVGTRYVYRVEPSWGDMKGWATERVPAAPLPVPVGNDGTFVPVTPSRVLDTRMQSGTRRPAPVGAGQTLTLDPATSGAVPRSGVSAVLLNVTGTRPTRSTYVTVWASDDGRPPTSSLNLLAGQTRPNQVVVPVGPKGTVSLYNHAGQTDLLVDVQGYYTDPGGVAGGGFHTTPPTRLLDTRRSGVPVGPGQSVWIPVSAPGLDAARARAVDVNVTVTGPSRAGHLTAWSGSGPAPTASNVNFAAGQTVANHAVVPVSRDQQGRPGIRVRNSDGSSHVLVDLNGWYDADARAGGLRFEPMYPARMIDTRDYRDRLAVGETLVLPGYSWGLPPAVAHAVNLTATRPLGPGYLTAWSGEGTAPRTSTVNFRGGETAPNLAVVTTGTDGRIAVTGQGARADVVLDHLGYFY